MKRVALLVLAGGCVHTHTAQVATPLGKDGGNVGLQLSAYTGWDGDPDDVEVEDTIEMMVMGDLVIDYGVHDNLDLGFEVGSEGAEAHAKLAVGDHRLSAAVLPSARIGWGTRGYDVSALVTYGALTAVGFYGTYDEIKVLGKFPIMGGGLGYRHKELRAGVEFQHWADPSSLELVLIYVSFVADDVDDIAQYFAP